MFYTRKLTSKQKRQLPVYAKKWIDIGLRTGPTDRDKVQDLINEAYRAGGLEPPRVKVWMQSPLAGMLAANMIESGSLVNQGSNQAWDQTRTQVKHPALNQIRVQVRAQIKSKVEDQVWNQVWDQVGSKVKAQVWDQVWDQVRIQVGDQTRAHSARAIWPTFWSSHEVHWLAFFTYFHEQLGIDCCSKLSSLSELAQQTGWVWTYRDVVIISDRPEFYSVFGGQLHSKTGPAVRYADGFCIYAPEGKRIPKEKVKVSANA